ncbi:hypothetical protein L7F22_021783 [Adiantum nelumboides]|nr:hypothetical protein [Adiantum nelumboides]
MLTMALASSCGLRVDWEDGVTGTLAAAVTMTKGGGGEVAVREQHPFSSAIAYVDGGVQGACKDSCSIYLGPFCHTDPATVTSCRHEYHLAPPMHSGMGAKEQRMPRGCNPSASRILLVKSFWMQWGINNLGGIQRWNLQTMLNWRIKLCNT